MVPPVPKPESEARSPGSASDCTDIEEQPATPSWPGECRERDPTEFSAAKVRACCKRPGPCGRSSSWRAADEATRVNAVGCGVRRAGSNDRQALLTGMPHSAAKSMCGGGPGSMSALNYGVPNGPLSPYGAMRGLHRPVVDDSDSAGLRKD